MPRSIAGVGKKNLLEATVILILLILLLSLLSPAASWLIIRIFWHRSPSFEVCWYPCNLSKPWRMLSLHRRFIVTFGNSWLCQRLSHSFFDLRCCYGLQILLYVKSSCSDLLNLETKSQQKQQTQNLQIKLRKKHKHTTRYRKLNETPDVTISNDLQGQPSIHTFSRIPSFLNHTMGLGARSKQLIPPALVHPPLRLYFLLSVSQLCETVLLSPNPFPRFFLHNLAAENKGESSNCKEKWAVADFAAIGPALSPRRPDSDRGRAGRETLL